MINLYHYLFLVRRTFLIIVTYILVLSCQFEKESALTEGKLLAGKYCSSCHLFPEPALLDKKTWINGVLPAMAGQLGIEVLQGNVYLTDKKSVLTGKEWSRLVEYYKTLAPDTLQKATVPVVASDDWCNFTLKKPAENPDAVSSTTMVAIDEKRHQIVTSSSERSAIYEYSSNLEIILSSDLPSAAIDISFAQQTSQEDIITCMGGMQAADHTKGQILEYRQKDSKANLLSSDLIRPIQTRPLDYNKDGLQDYVVCAFGHNRGGLYILKQDADHTFEKVPVREVPGATQSVVQDFNHDGWPDIMTLFAHGDEGIWLFLNNQHGGFTTKNILRFPPSSGSSSFQLIDMDKDGKEDIVYTAGDNSDYSRILKPYHGIYIYKNTGNLHFEKSYFYPVNGCTKAIAADFDKDGDIDVAVIAFFADFKSNPAQTFLYFEHVNEGITFKPHNVPVAASGRWICMDASDYDNDGDIDIVLGNYSKGFLNQENVKPSWNIHTPFVVLENNILNKKNK
ncbi:VCBS repeat-containing protein [Dyadobacter sediminis]|uniref:VCBS repeat-containing protein n=1 Tax=Dyadobacter sediminis TaxID=1493691 RepID=A0A5R9KAL1_9BACT|nr:VCBS repeat-containing protein [Dyadobacter sediminis]